MSQKNPPHPWHEGPPYGRQQKRNPLPATAAVERSSSNAGAAKANSCSHHRRRFPRGSAATPQGKPKRSSSRLWQLPEDSITGYAQWIQEKPEADQTPSERRFLWKYLMRHLGVKRNDRKTRQFVEELQAKPNCTVMEVAFLQQYRKRRQDRKSSNNPEDTVIVWERQPHQHNMQNNSKESSTISTSGPTNSLRSLRESMEKLGLSFEKLKEPVSGGDTLME
ncbi:hypothetical protein IV203_016881 [Nitzschia inconspicua]|uniref:Uncharacterized protein n=1 Tax=Nitzschia inconspicua TaxID=303405 RepID=A0A9K3PIP3_9STRA|nr:hypothetical protein IV203_016881 [Nitzschia inconspicua]